MQKVLLYLTHGSIVTLYKYTTQPMTLIEVPAWKYLVLQPILSTGNKIIGWFPCNINKIGQVWWDHACTCDKTSQGDEIIPVLVTK